MPEPSTDKRPFQFSLGRLMMLPVGVAGFCMFGTWAGMTPTLLLAGAAGVVGVLLIPSITVVERLTCVAIVCILTALFLPAVQSGGHSGRPECINHLKQIALAMYNYHDTYGCLPPAYIADQDGKPIHSWRVLILPYMEQQALYDQYDFDEPWNGPNNSLLHNTIVDTYSCPSNGSRTTTMTSYVAITGEETPFAGDQSTALTDFADGTSNTILVVETCGSDIHWMEPRDLATETIHLAINPGKGKPPGISSYHPGCANVAFADGSVRFLADDLPAKTLRGMFTIAGGETIDPDE